jgi:ribonucleoside-diphosphate reductase alpha chain
LIERHLVATGFMNPREKLDLPPEIRAIAVAGEGRKGRPCPRCGNPTLVQLEGCDTCVSCGFSRCG